MRSSRANSPALLAAAFLFAACAKSPVPLLEPMQHRQPPLAPLPDQRERAAAALARAALAERCELAQRRLEELGELERESRARGEPPSGLLDNAQELLAALSGPEAYGALARELPAQGEPDPALRRRLERHLAQQPLVLAERRMAEHRRRELAEIFNRITVPATRLAFGVGLEPLQATRAALGALAATRRMPQMSTQERQALRAREEFLALHPDAEEAEELRQSVRDERARLARLFESEAIERAEAALKAGRPDAALSHLDRAARLAPPGEDALELRARAVTRALERAAALGRAFGFEQELRDADLAGLHSGVISTLPGRTLPSPQLPAELSDEFAFAAAWRVWGEDARFEELETIARLDPGEHNMARHALALVRDPLRNPWRAYREARSRDRSARTRWLLLGPVAGGARQRGLPRALELLIDVPTAVVALATVPLRVAQYSGRRSRFGAERIRAGESYLARFPEGAHAYQVRDELEQLYAARGHFARAYALRTERLSSDDETAREYRERVAERMLAAAAAHPRIDVRAAIYRSIVLEYEGTRQAEHALRAFQRAIEEATPQQIRVSRALLVEWPELRAPDALGLVDELFDGDEENGELAEGGVTLIGQTAVKIELEDREPLTRRVPPAQFSRFAALLEELSYMRLASDLRERPEPDPQRDLFLERARLGLLDAPDMRPAAGSRAEYLSTTEKHGALRRRDSILPVEIVLQGGLEDLGLATFPRLVLPTESEDAFLYR